MRTIAWFAPALLLVGAACSAAPVGRACDLPKNASVGEATLAFEPAYPCWLPAGYAVNTVALEPPDPGGLSHGLTLTLRDRGRPILILTQRDHDPGYLAVNLGATGRAVDIDGVEGRLYEGDSGAGQYLYELRWRSGGRFYQLHAVKGPGVDEGAVLRLARSLP